MNSLNYFKLDFLMTKSMMKIFLPILVVCTFVFSRSSYIIMCLYMFFLLITFVATPFSIGSNEKSEKMYNMFPSEVSSMVLGRYLYLIFISLAVWIISIAMISYTFSNGHIDSLMSFTIVMVGLITTMLCFIQYPIYYKLGLEKGRLVSTLIQMVPSFTMFLLPSVILEKIYDSPDNVNKVLGFISGKEGYLIITMFFIVVITAYISYLASCMICKNKEI